MTSKPPPRARRADARRNRARILEAADAVFAEQGPGAVTEDIARRAGVAIGTVFRHFPSKQALVEAVFITRLRFLTEQARALCAAESSGEEFFDFFARWVELSADKQSFVDALTAAGVDVQARAAAGEYPVVRAELLEAVAALLRQAQRAGAVRADIGAPEITALLIGTARALQHAGAQQGPRARLLRVLFDGLRPQPDRAGDRDRSDGARSDSEG